uniref:Putative aminotransferase n=1 Tax=Sphaerisporangium sp. SANK 60911 TaxID=1354075 RepID=V5YTA0_9ACTN|nr:putative aminotransferase [Sphaerisporangium sp. SANK 60911]
MSVPLDADDGVPENAAGFADVPCVRYYRTIRDGVGNDALQIGYGVNRTPPAPVVREWLVALYQDFLRQRVGDYEVPEGVRERALIAWLAGRYLGVPGLGPDNVMLCNGTSEAISVVTGYAAREDLHAVLPLPLYFSFEQSASRYRLPIAAYYNMRGDVVTAGSARPRRVLHVDVAPNGVIGSWAGHAATEEPALRIVDHVFALPTYQEKSEFLRTLRARIGDLGRTVVLLTPSKDLSLPGVRCGTLITANPHLLAYAHADRFERGYSVHGGTARVSAAHLALLLIAFEPGPTLPALLRELRAEFASAGLVFPTDAQVQEFLAHLAATEADFRRNLAQIDASGSFAAVTRGGEQVAGYSGFRHLNGPFRTARELTGWVWRAGLSGMKLNPNYLFGARPEVWDRLYPGVLGVRVNLSVPPAQLARDLVRLRELLLDPDLAA